MINPVWIPATVMAAAFQVARNAVQRGLLPNSGPWAATLVRFLFGLPFSLAFAVVAWRLTPGAQLHPTGMFWVGAVIGALAQVLATSALLVAMNRAGFAIGAALQQSSLPFSAILGMAFYRAPLSLGAWIGVAIATGGLAVLTWPRAPSTGDKPVSGAAFGLLSGAAFAVSLNSFRQAGLILDPLHPAFSALALVVVVQAMQSTGLIAYLLARDPAALAFVLRNWRRSIGAGFYGAVASGGWFVALAMAPSASAVRAVGIIESPIAALVGRRLFKERLRPGQIAAGLAVLIGVLLTVLA